MPRFVILEHDHPHRHWDFMLETGNVLATWRLPQPPGPEPQTMTVERIGDHRVMYLDYEGPLSQNRGSVTRWDAGTFAVEIGPLYLIHLSGERWRGRVQIQQDERGEQFHFQPDH